MKIIAIKECSAGNESVGEMWKETKIFGDSNTLKEVMQWIHNSKKQNVILSIPDGEKNPDDPFST